MREFVEGNDNQYMMLKNSLNDNRCHVYRCVLPASFNRTNCRIGFEKERTTNGYALYIDKGLEFYNCAFPLFNEWLRTGTIRFMDFNDVKTFLRKLNFIYR